VKRQKEMDPKEIKKGIKDLEKKLKDNAKKPTLNEEEVWEISDKLEALKGMLEAQKVAK